MGRRTQCPKGRVVFIGDARLGRYCPRVNATCPADDGSAPVFGKGPVCRFAHAVTPTASSHARPGVGRARLHSTGLLAATRSWRRDAGWHAAWTRRELPISVSGPPVSCRASAGCAAPGTVASFRWIQTEVAAFIELSYTHLRA